MKNHEMVDGLPIAIHQYRKSTKMTMAQLGKKIGKSRQAVSDYENGKVKLDIDTLCDMASAFNMKLVNFIETAAMLGKKETISAEEDAPSIAEGEFSEKIRYIYFYNQVYKKLSKCVVIFKPKSDPGNKDLYRVKFYYMVDDVETTKGCLSTYAGDGRIRERDIRMDLSREAITQDTLNVLVASMPAPNIYCGYITKTSAKDHLPVVFNIILSNRKIKETKEFGEIVRKLYSDNGYLRKHPKMILPMR